MNPAHFSIPSGPWLAVGAFLVTLAVISLGLSLVAAQAAGALLWVSGLGLAVWGVTR